jgi:hypothetical protein
MAFYFIGLSFSGAGAHNLQNPSTNGKKTQTLLTNKKLGKMVQCTQPQLGLLPVCYCTSHSEEHKKV